MTSSTSCAVIGDWHLAFTTAGSLSKLGHQVLFVNPNLSGAGPWSGKPPLPVSEPGLAEALDEGSEQGRVRYLNGINSSWSAPIVWLAIDTPVDENDKPDTSTLKTAVQQLKDNRNVGELLIVSSQVPLGFCARLEEILGKPVAYIPENLRLGQGLKTFLQADRTVIGSRSVSAREKVQSFLNGVESDFLLCNLETAEMIKHATNAFLATSISFANELARIGEQYGIDNHTVGKALKLDKRIGKSAYVMPGLGFAGGTLPRDLRVLQELARERGVKSELVDAVLEVNQSTTDAIVRALADELGTFAGKKILILGYTYKADTDTLRRSIAVDIATQLKTRGSEVWGFDPFMNGKNISAIQGQLRHFEKWSDIPSQPEIVLLMTPRNEFKDISWKQLKEKISVPESKKSPLIFDSQGMLASEKILEAGFRFKSLWQPLQTAETAR